MWFSLSEQTAYFLWSIVLGAFAAAVYDIVCAVRVFLRAGKFHVIISDILFFILCGILTSLFALPFNKGSVRVFIIFGEAIGFLCYRLTLGRFVGRFYGIMSKGITWILRKICEMLKKFFDLLLKTASFVVYNVSVLKDRFVKSVSARIKKVRKNRNDRRKVRKNNRHVRKTVKSRQSGTGNTKRKSYERRYKKEKKSPRKRGRR